MQIKKTQLKGTAIALLITGFFSLTGCGTPGKGTIPAAGDMTMAQIYYQQTGLSVDSDASSNPNASSEAPDGLILARTTAPGVNISTDYTGDASQSLNRLNTQFKTLANPQILVYVMPHLVTTAANTEAPVPGYVTSIFMYPKNEFAMPYEHY